MSVLSELAAGAGGGLVVLVVQSGWALWHDKKDSKTIYAWMAQEAGKPNADTFR